MTHHLRIQGRPASVRDTIAALLEAHRLDADSTLAELLAAMQRVSA
jgi:hypothetical protein